MTEDHNTTGEHKNSLDALRRRHDAANRCQPLEHSGRRDPLFGEYSRGFSGDADTTVHRPRPYGAFGPPAEATPIELLRRALKIATTDEERAIITAAGRKLKALKAAGE